MVVGDTADSLGARLMEAARVAEAAAEAIRELNHATLDPTALDHGTVYEVLGALESLVFRLPQALRQLNSAVARRAGVDLLKLDNATDPAVAAASADWFEAAVEDAVSQLDQAAHSIDALHQAASHFIFAQGWD